MTVTAELDGWEAEIAAQTMIRPSQVQNRLLSLHDLVDGSARQWVERWLTGSTSRTLYRRDEVEGMIEALRREPARTG